MKSQRAVPKSIRRANDSSERFSIPAGAPETVPGQWVVDYAGTCREHAERKTAASNVRYHDAFMLFAQWICSHDGDQDRYTVHIIYGPPWVRPSDRFESSSCLLATNDSAPTVVYGGAPSAGCPVGDRLRGPNFDG